MTLSALFHSFDELLDAVFLKLVSSFKNRTLLTICALLTACLSLIFVAGPCSAPEDGATSGTVEATKVSGQVSRLVTETIKACSLAAEAELTDEQSNALNTLLPARDDDCESLVSWSYFHKRPWFDKFPSDPHGKYKAYFFSDKAVGAYIEIEYMKQINEFFFFKRVLNRFAYLFPYSKHRGLTRFKLESCQGPGTCDLKLTIINDPKDNKKNRVFYSWRNFKQPK